jgi:hypothetical protein
MQSPEVHGVAIPHAAGSSKHARKSCGDGIGAAVLRCVRAKSKVRASVRTLDCMVAVVELDEC